MAKTTWFISQLVGSLQRPEGVEAGTLKVIGTNKQNVYHTPRKELMDG